MLFTHMLLLLLQHFLINYCMSELEPWNQSMDNDNNNNFLNSQRHSSNLQIMLQNVTSIVRYRDVNKLHFHWTNSQARKDVKLSVVILSVSKKSCSDSSSCCNLINHAAVQSY